MYIRIDLSVLVSSGLEFSSDPYSQPFTKSNPLSIRSRDYGLSMRNDKAFETGVHDDDDVDVEAAEAEDKKAADTTGKNCTGIELLNLFTLWRPTRETVVKGRSVEAETFIDTCFADSYNTTMVG